MEALYKEYKLEQRKYKLFVSLLRYFGFFMLGFYLYLLFFKKGLDTKYFLLNIYGMYCNASVFILFEIYKIPTLFENLFSKNEKIVGDSYQLIHTNRDEILKPFLFELFGRNYTEEQLLLQLEGIKDLIKSLDRLEWRKIGKIYFTGFFIISILVFYFLFPIE